MLKNAITVTLDEQELRTIFEALVAKSDWLNKHCIQGTGNNCKDLADVFHAAKEAKLTIEYK